MQYLKLNFIGRTDFSAVLNLCIKLLKKLQKFDEFDTLPADLSFPLNYSNNANGEESTRAHRCAENYVLPLVA